jgi:hypothetical protein
MKTQTILILSLLFLLFADSCKKKKCGVKPNKMQQEMLDWIFFKEGSYWIYQDTISGAYDSVYVFKSEFVEDDKYFEKPDDECPISISDYIKNTIVSIRGEHFRIAGAYGIGSGVQNNTNPVEGMAQIVNENHGGGDGGYSQYMFFPVLQGTVGQWASSWTLIKHDTIYSQHEVAGKVYDNVLRVHDNYNAAYNADTKFYHSKNIGVIKKEIYQIDQKNPQSELIHVWELVRYEVHQ